jgi:hypothetical protein
MRIATGEETRDLEQTPTSPAAQLGKLGGLRGRGRSRCARVMGCPLSCGPSAIWLPWLTHRPRRRRSGMPARRASRKSTSDFKLRHSPHSPPRRHLAPTPPKRGMHLPGDRRWTGASPTRSGPEGSSRNGSPLGSFAGLPLLSFRRSVATITAALSSGDRLVCPAFSRTTPPSKTMRSRYPRGRGCSVTRCP